jgi:hypothetical protein
MVIRMMTKKIRNQKNREGSRWPQTNLDPEYPSPIWLNMKARAKPNNYGKIEIIHDMLKLIPLAINEDNIALPHLPLKTVKDSLIISTLPFWGGTCIGLHRF